MGQTLMGDVTRKKLSDLSVSNVCSNWNECRSLFQLLNSGVYAKFLLFRPISVYVLSVARFYQ